MPVMAGYSRIIRRQIALMPPAAGEAADRTWAGGRRAGPAPAVPAVTEITVTGRPPRSWLGSPLALVFAGRRDPLSRAQLVHLSAQAGDLLVLDRQLAGLLRLLLAAARPPHHEPHHGAHADRAAERRQQVEQVAHLLFLQFSRARARSVRTFARVRGAACARTAARS